MQTFGSLSEQSRAKSPLRPRICKFIKAALNSAWVKGQKKGRRSPRFDYGSVNNMAWSMRPETAAESVLKLRERRAQAEPQPAVIVNRTKFSRAGDAPAPSDHHNLHSAPRNRTALLCLRRGKRRKEKKKKKKKPCNSWTQRCDDFCSGRYLAFLCPTYLGDLVERSHLLSQRNLRRFLSPTVTFG